MYADSERSFFFYQENLHNGAYWRGKTFFIYIHFKRTLLLPVMFAGIQCSFLTESNASWSASLIKTSLNVASFVTTLFRVFSKRIDRDFPAVDTVTHKNFLQFTENEIEALLSLTERSLERVSQKLRPRKLRPQKLRHRKLRPRKLRPWKLRPLEIKKKKI